MIGDVLGARHFFNGGGNVSLAGGDRAAKIADDSSPLPTDRVFFDYNYFSQANVTANHAVVGLDRYTLGIEKTFLDGLGSVEIKAPIDSGLASNQNVFATTSANEGTVFGDLTVSPKILLFADSGWAASAGVTFDFPTAPRAELFVPEPSSSRTRVMDNSVHVEPFLGLQIAPCERLFSIAYLQLDMDANGNDVLEQRSTQPFSMVGRLREPTVLYADFSAGYWLFHDLPVRLRLRQRALPDRPRPGDRTALRRRPAKRPPGRRHPRAQPTKRHPQPDLRHPFRTRPLHDPHARLRRPIAHAPARQGIRHGTDRRTEPAVLRANPNTSPSPLWERAGGEVFGQTLRVLFLATVKSQSEYFSSPLWERAGVRVLTDAKGFVSCDRQEVAGHRSRFEAASYFRSMTACREKIIAPAAARTINDQISGSAEVVRATNC